MGMKSFKPKGYAVNYLSSEFNRATGGKRGETICARLARRRSRLAGLADFIFGYEHCKDQLAWETDYRNGYK